MTFCFLSALNAEIQYLLDCSTIEKEEQLGFAKLYTLNYKDVRYFVCVSGVGKVLSGSAATACCIAHPEIDAFINIGIGGSLDASKAPLLSAILGSSFVQHDMDTSALGDPYGYLDGLKCVEIPADPVLNQKIEQACAALNIGFISRIYLKSTISSRRILSTFALNDAIFPRVPRFTSRP